MKRELSIRIRFPYPNGQWKDVGNNWKVMKSTFFYCIKHSYKQGIIKRALDTTKYYAYVNWSDKDFDSKKEKHYFL